MGTRRKKERAQVFQRLPWSPSGSSYVSGRKLSKGDLGGAIFGCTNSTMEECLTKKLFGLPSSRFRFVRNIEPGMTLFLFNYSYRKLHGIYEAVSHGEMNMDPYAWTNDGREKTGFPAQVRIRVRMECKSITENQFKNVISDNYYGPRHFCFELDHAQTEGLIALFLASDLSMSAMTPSPASNDDNLCTTLAATKCNLLTNFESVHSKTVEQRRVNEFPLPNYKDECIEYGSKGTIPATNATTLGKEPSCSNPIEGNVVSHSDVIHQHEESISQTLPEQKFCSENLERGKTRGQMVEKPSADPNCFTFLSKPCIDCDSPYVPRSINEGSKFLEKSSISVEKENTTTSDACDGNERFAPAAAELHDVLYATGGYDGQDYLQMGTRKKTERAQVFERLPCSPSGSGYVSGRKLSKLDLGGVIFGCTNSTMEECLTKQLFGLPSSHFRFVRNIEPGLTLFLFNYSYRKLHGIYEAVSHGEMNMDPYAWTNDGRKKTGFPAQVRIRVRMECKSITENQFKNVISDNYYGPRHFCFELDHAQTEGLLALFLASDLSMSAMTPPPASDVDNLCTTSAATKCNLLTNFESVHSKTVERRRVNEFPLPNYKDECIEYGSKGIIPATNTTTLGNPIDGNVVSHSDVIHQHEESMSQTLPEQKFCSENLERGKTRGQVVEKPSADPNCFTFLSNSCIDCHSPYVPRAINEGSKFLEKSSVSVEKENTTTSDACNGNESVQIVEELK